MRSLPLALAAAGLLGACRASPPPAFEPHGPVPGEPEERTAGGAADRERARRGEEIAVAGELVRTGAPVVLWYDPGGYSAYRARPHFGGGGPTGLRYRPGRGAPASSRADVLRAVDQLVLHYDVCGVSRECFRVLHDVRGLSVHFLVDVDGTIYQTLDVRDTAWHAREANARSIGVEIASIGAYPPGETEPLERWYGEDAGGTRITLPARLGDGGVRTPGFVGRPARPGPIEGRIHGALFRQHDFTPEQYESLARLAAALTGALPRLPLEVPRDASGAPLPRALAPADLERFSGVLAHWHVTEAKRDPGPAFDWERFLSRAREVRDAAGTPSP